MGPAQTVRAQLRPKDIVVDQSHGVGTMEFATEGEGLHAVVVRERDPAQVTVRPIQGLRVIVNGEIDLVIADVFFEDVRMLS